MSNMSRIAELIESLPPDLQQKVEEYARSLIGNQQPNAERYLKLDWAGSAWDPHDTRTSVEIQHDVLKEWEKMAMDEVSPEEDDTPDVPGR